MRRSVSSQSHPDPVAPKFLLSKSPYFPRKYKPWTCPINPIHELEPGYQPKEMNSTRALSGSRPIACLSADFTNSISSSIMHVPSKRQKQGKSATDGLDRDWGCRMNWGWRIEEAHIQPETLVSEIAL
ncbi:hypothetical protein QN277_010568 [Acacia crassicarpa]|uniref:Uncharacterized protein n=1 Tax=Acacia crassicarpa TaxID=499986 RepID=A0AAE1MB74_9FABA|nr:hypothetical protein QN277_010568 [Acacia crassicarpa]